MRLIIQRVTKASVEVEGAVIGAIDRGYLVLLGVGTTDTEADADRLIKKMVNLRIFPDETGKINRSLKDIDGSLLVVSQFTLYADTSHGNRPGFSLAAKPDEANRLYEYFLSRCREEIAIVESGQFGADMQVSLVNDGPFTITLE